MLLQCVSLLLPVAATCGWYCGYRERHKINGKQMFKLRKDYFRGLSYVIDDQPDKAVDVFVQLLEVDSDTVETHLALGSLFRRRGEVDRAIRIHQNLIARPQLSQDYKLAALLALGQDYLSAGVLDRAEKIFLRLVKYGYDEKTVLPALIRIYQQEKDWGKAIQIARKFESSMGVSKGAEISHFYCEIATEKIERSQWSQVKSYLKQAVAADRFNPRTCIVQAQFYVQQNDDMTAIEHYKRALELDCSLVPLVLPSLFACFNRCGKPAAFLRFVVDDLRDKHYLSLLPPGELRQVLYASSTVNAVLSSALDQNVSLAGLDYGLALSVQQCSGAEREGLDKMRRWLAVLLQQYPKYQCYHCGFETQSASWICPSCHSWSTVRSTLDQPEE